MKDILKSIEKFKKFTTTDVNAAVKELESIKSESNRKHLQRLVYVNLVNRFDALIDNLLLKFSVLEGKFKQKVLNETREEEVFLRDIYQILLADDPRSAVKERVEAVTRGNFLNLRHSMKLRVLLSDCFVLRPTDLERPRVFTNNGSIFVDTKRLKPFKIPDSVLGYSDWLYSRRNALVHGEGKILEPKDIDIIGKKFGAKVAPTISLKISSIKSAARFYVDLCDILLEAKANEIIE